MGSSSIAIFWQGTAEVINGDTILKHDNQKQKYINIEVSAGTIISCIKDAELKSDIPYKDLWITSAHHIAHRELG